MTKIGFIGARMLCPLTLYMTHVPCEENPADPSKLLIGFETGSLCLWDLSNKKGEQR
jgi:hypothetical protein